MRRNWTPGEIRKLKQLRDEGKSLAEIADILGRSYDSVNSAFSHRFKKIPPSAFPVWDAPLTTQGDALILTDIEAPFQHSDFLNRCLDLADAWGVRTLHIGGDLIHYASLSQWAPNHSGNERIIESVLQALDLDVDVTIINKLESAGLLQIENYTAELREARRVFANMDGFDTVVVDIGNHDDRYLRALNQAIHPEELLRQLDKQDDSRWKIAPYYYSFVETERGTFRVTHPRGTGRTAAQDLAVQHHQHIIMGHSHRWSVNRDPSGTYWAIQTGHCVDETRLAYVMQRDAKRDAHALGATIIRGGYPFVLCEQSPWDMLRRM